MNKDQEMAPSEATELHIEDLFEEVGRMVHIFSREYRSWALGHRTDQELAAIEHDWAVALERLNQGFEAEVKAHIEARRATRARYQAEMIKLQGNRCDRCSAPAEAGTLQNIGIAPDHTFYVCRVCRQEIGRVVQDRPGATQRPAQKIAEQLQKYALQAEEARLKRGSPPEGIFVDLAEPFHPPTPPVDTTSTEPPTTTDVKRPGNTVADAAQELISLINGIFGPDNIRQATPFDDRSTWPVRMLENCPCAACKAELQRRKAAEQSTLGDVAKAVGGEGAASRIMGIPPSVLYGEAYLDQLEDLAYGPPQAPVHDPDGEATEPTNFNPYEYRGGYFPPLPY